MRTIDAVTNHHPLFLKSAYKHGDFIKLHNTPDTIKSGTKYITFDEQHLTFRVYVRVKEEPRVSGIFNNIESAMFHARRR